MPSIQVLPAVTRRQKEIFLTFPWRVYRRDPLWVPPLLPELRKRIDPGQGKFFRDGYAELFIAWRGGKPVGTISCAEDRNASRQRGQGWCTLGFFECLEDYEVAAALFDHAAEWARTRDLKALDGTFNLDREDGRGILIEGRDRPAAVYCGHSPVYYQGFFERYGFEKSGGDGIAYAIDIDLASPPIQRVIRLAEKIRERKGFRVRGANLNELESEIDRVLDLQNRGLAHMPSFVPYTRAQIEAMIMPMLDVVDPELVLVAELDGQAVGWFPAVPNLNEIFIHINGLRHPWDYLRALRYRNYKPKSISIKSVIVVPEHWDTGAGVLLFAEMAIRAAAKGYTWADLSLTGEDNLDTWPLAHRIGAKIYKRYRFYRKML